MFITRTTWSTFGGGGYLAPRRSSERLQRTTKGTKWPCRLKNVLATSIVCHLMRLYKTTSTYCLVGSQWKGWRRRATHWWRIWCKNVLKPVKLVLDPIAGAVSNVKVFHRLTSTAVLLGVPGMFNACRTQFQTSRKRIPLFCLASRQIWLVLQILCLIGGSEGQKNERCSFNLEIYTSITIYSDFSGACDVLPLRFTQWLLYEKIARKMSFKICSELWR